MLTLLSNIYLHYVLDDWRRSKPPAT